MHRRFPCPVHPSYSGVNTSEVRLFHNRKIETEMRYILQGMILFADQLR